MAHWYFVKVFQSQIARKITFWVFGSLLMIEAIILFPSYFKRENDLLAAQTSIVTTSLDTALTNLSTTAVAPLSAVQIGRVLQQLKNESKILDFALFGADGDRITPVNSLFDSSFDDIRLQNNSSLLSSLLRGPELNRLKQTYDTAIALDDTVTPTYLLIRYDTAAVQKELNAYTGRMLSMILLISIVVTLGTMIGVERLVIRPVLYLQSDLILASLQISQGIRDNSFKATTLKQDDELGHVITAFEHLYDQVWQAIDAQTQANRLKQVESDRAEQLHNALQQLHATQAQLVQVEKMSSLGQLVAGIAHEINNPINFINGNLQHSQQYVTDLLELVALYRQHYPTPPSAIQAAVEDIDLDFLEEDLPKLLASMKHGSERVHKIVLSLRNFSRMDEEGFKFVDIHAGIDSTLDFLTHRMVSKAQILGIHIEKIYGDLPLVECQAGLLNQVFMNILTNAIEALEKQAQQQTPQNNNRYPGRITIKTTKVRQPDQNQPDQNQSDQSQQVQIEIANNGTALAPVEQQRMFDPFFTTKPVGKGTGMGLAICYQIVVVQHQGTLECSVTPAQNTASQDIASQNTRFIIQLPIKQTHSL